MACLRDFGSVCVVNCQKMDLEDVVIIDDSKPYHFIASHRTVLAIVSISKSLVVAEIPWILCAADKKFKDNGHILFDTIEREWRRILEEPDLFADTSEIAVMEKKIVKAVKYAFAG